VTVFLLTWTYLNARLTKQCFYVATVRSIHAALEVNQNVVVGKINSSFLTTHACCTVRYLTLCPSSHTSCLRYVRVTQHDIFAIWNTGCFIMFSVITNIYNRKTKGLTLMELFTASGKLKKVFYFLFIYLFFDKAHTDTIFKFLSHTLQHGCINMLYCCNDPCL
jgi:hypothetical protein